VCRCTCVIDYFWDGAPCFWNPTRLMLIDCSFSPRGSACDTALLDAGDLISAEIELIRCTTSTDVFNPCKFDPIELIGNFPMKLLSPVVLIYTGR